MCCKHKQSTSAKRDHQGWLGVSPPKSAWLKGLSPAACMPARAAESLSRVLTRPAPLLQLVEELPCMPAQIDLPCQALSATAQLPCAALIFQLHRHLRMSGPAHLPSVACLTQAA